MDETFSASRLTVGNQLFPDTIRIAEDGIHFRKAHLFGSNEETINYKHIASVRVSNGILFSSLAIETSGGSQPITINGFGRGTAKRIKELIEQQQAKYR